MRRTAALLMPVLVAAVMPALPASAVDPPAPPSPGWSVSGDVVRWTAPEPVPMTDSGVEFWEGDRFLGRADEAPDLRTFTVHARLTNPAALEVRSGDDRLDVPEPPLPSAAAPDLPAQRPAADVDPGVPGPYGTVTAEYELDPFTFPGYRAPVEMKGVVVGPQGAPGKRPLVLFLHGRHNTCYVPGTGRSSGDWPCPEGTEAVPSHRGYLKTQELLASQGYLTVSISANAVNAQDEPTPDSGAQARSSLVRHHLAKWAEWSDAGSPPVPGRADLTNVLLVGHSRGGEGVNRAAFDSVAPPDGDTGFSGPVRWTVRGTVLIGPTLFGQNPAPDVPSVTILPGCDGDVADLQGQLFVDQTRGLGHDEALHSALYVVGANHNFFNTEWTPGLSEAPSVDDFGDDPMCRPGASTRLTPQQQQAVGATYVAASARLFVAGDEQVLPLLDGSGVRAPSADPARVLSHAVGAARTPFVVPAASTTTSGSARLCQAVSRDEEDLCSELRSPHFARFRQSPTQPERVAIALKWTSAGQSAVVSPSAPVSLEGSRSLALRIAVPAGAPESPFGVIVTDHNGQKHDLGPVAVTGLPGAERLSAVWAQEVRVALPSGLGRAASLELVPRSEQGEAWLIDAQGWKEGLVPVTQSTPARVDAVITPVREGDSGTSTYNAVVTAGGEGTRVARIFYTPPGSVEVETKLVTFAPGETRTEVPTEVTGNTRWGGNRHQIVAVQALSGVVAGAAVGGLQVLEDDPVPDLTVTPSATAVEGAALTWTLSLSEPADVAFVLLASPTAPAEGPELSTTDVDAEWFQQNSGEEALPSRPLSSTQLAFLVVVPPGETSVQVPVPTVTDAETEGAEKIGFRFDSLAPPGFQVRADGEVTDPA